MLHKQPARLVGQQASRKQTRSAIQTIGASPCGDTEGKEERTVNFQEVPHAAVNELMQWVRWHGQHVISLHTWPHLAGWSSLPEWSAHIEVQGRPPLHVRIKRTGYQFAIVYEPDDSGCPACDAHRGVAQVSPDPVEQAAGLITQDWDTSTGVALQSHEQRSLNICGPAHA